MKEIKKIINIALQPYMRILPGNLAFSFMMALLPVLTLFVSVTNILNISTPAISSRLSNIIPEAVLDTLIVFLNGKGFNDILLIIIGVWSASVGMNALIIASNVIYDYENTTYLARRIKSIVLTFLVIIIIIINLLILVFGDALVKFILKLFELSPAILTLFSLIKWPIAIIIIYLIVKVIYTAAPDKNIKSSDVTKGSVFTTIMWILSSAIYSFYVSNIAKFTLYGSLANIIILLIWLYIISYVMMIGTAINVNEYKKNNN